MLLWSTSNALLAGYPWTALKAQTGRARPYLQDGRFWGFGVLWFSTAMDHSRLGARPGFLGALPN